ncbi:Mannose-6-phosphate isomerase, cupin superfamily [Syntrophus gentianae]|uniref:Mannose-6-phosphate isomerase, cupin superfamily n=1 Tax=Syntrophus gentianae TaxID=43775 RepID=A0A1H7ZGI7_9BACT|nr:glycosyltransferase [Syntrophus gentianae]SEM57530.1 Mannose-6-phosphate isomerase, cupin superfamily [Syntrophus gentianae]
MKVALILPFNWCSYSGNSSPWGNIVSPLKEGLVICGIDVVLFAAGDLNASRSWGEMDDGIYYGNSSNLPEVREWIPWSKASEQEDHFDIIHNYFDCLPLTRIGVTNIPVLTTVQGFSSPNKHSKKNSFYVAVNEAQKNPELEYVATIPQGVDLRRCTFQAEKGKYLLFIGSIAKDKGAKKCIDIARETGMPLILVGGINDKGYFDRHIGPHIDGDGVIYLSSVDPEKRDELLSGTYALLQPVSSEDSLKFALMHAMACGTPVIALNEEDMQEIVENGATGILVENSDEMARAVAKAGQLDRFQCRKWVEERFSATRMVKAYIRDYEKVIEQTKGENHRPWGYYEILSEDTNHKIKRITVYPGQRLSYQRHQRRAEHWYLISGRAVVTKAGKDTELIAGQAVDIPIQTWHRIANTELEELCFIEVQTGDYFGEDDVERSEDDYGRIVKNSTI